MIDLLVERQFEPGQKVLVMLPSHESKLLAKWQGPYEVKRKLGSTTYEVALSDQNCPTRTLHINLLKQWVPRPDKSAQSLMIKQVKEEEESDDQYLPQLALGEVDLGHLFTAATAGGERHLFTWSFFRVSWVHSVDRT